MCGMPKNVPLRFVLLKHLALRVVTDHTGVDEAGKVQRLGSELRHCVKVFASLAERVAVDGVEVGG